MKIIRTLAIVSVVLIAILVWLSLGKESNAPGPDGAPSSNETSSSQPQNADNVEGASTGDATAESQAGESYLEQTVVTGRVVRSGTSEGIPGVTVKTDGLGKFSTTTDAEGTYTFENLFPGKWHIRARSGGAAVSQLALYDASTVIIRELGAVDGPTLELDVGLIITGTVIDLAREPVADAFVTLHNATTLNDPRYSDSDIAYQSDDAAYTTTDAEGRFVIVGTSTDAFGFLRVVKEGYAVHRSEPFRMETGEFNFMLQTGSSLSGTVIDQDGQPVENVYLVVIDEADREVEYRRDFVSPYDALTGPTGSFRIPSLSTGTYRLHAQIVGPMNTRPTSQAWLRKPRRNAQPHAVVSMGFGENREGYLITLNIRKPPAGNMRTVSGKVLNESGAPIPNATMERHLRQGGKPTTTAADGSYSATFPESDRMPLEAKADGYHPQLKNLHSTPESTVDYVLKAQTFARGRVIDAVTKEPIERFIISKKSRRTMEPGGGYGEVVSYRSREGRFSFASPRQLPAYFAIQADGYLSGSFNAVASTGAGDEQVVELQPGPVVEGIVVDAFGESVSNARIYLGPFPEVSINYASTQGDPFLTYSESDGRFQLSVVPLETTQVTAFHPDHSFASEKIKPAAGETSRVTIQLAQGATVEGGVYWGSDPVPNQQVSFSLRQGKRTLNQTTRTDKNGRFKMSGLVPGNWRVLALLRLGDEWSGVSSYRNSKAGRITIFGGETGRYDVEFERFDTHVKGIVTGVEFVPGTLEVAITEGPKDEWAPGNGTAEVFSDGTFEIRHIPPGERDLYASVRTTDGFSVSEKVTIHIDEGTINELVVPLQPATGNRLTAALSGADNLSTIAITVYPGRVSMNNLNSVEPLRNYYGSVGDFRFQLPEAGTYTLVAQPKYVNRAIQQPSQSAVVNVTEDGPNHVRFSF